MPLGFVVEGGTGVGQLARQQLESADFSVRVLLMNNNVPQLAEKARPAVIMIDALACGGAGLDLCVRIRMNRFLARTPVILLAFQASEDQRIAGLEMGGDDYITGLYSATEFVARVQAVIRRFARSFPPEATLSSGTVPGALPVLTLPIRTKDIELDPLGMKILVRGDEIETTTLEFRLMYYLSYHRSRVFTRDQLLDAVWGTQYASPRCVDACVRRLRKKIEPNLTKPTYLKTVRGAGYCFTA